MFGLRRITDIERYESYEELRKKLAGTRAELHAAEFDRDRWARDCKKAWNILHELRLDDIRRNGT